MIYLDKLTLENNNKYNKVKYAYHMYQSSNCVHIYIEITI